MRLNRAIFPYYFSSHYNVVEYEALFLDLCQLTTLEAKRVFVHSDSRLLVNQDTNEFEAKEDRMKLYVQKLKKVKVAFETFEIKKIPQR